MTCFFVTRVKSLIMWCGYVDVEVNSKLKVKIIIIDLLFLISRCDKEVVPLGLQYSSDNLDVNPVRFGEKSFCTQLDSSSSPRPPNQVRIPDVCVTKCGDCSMAKSDFVLNIIHIKWSSCKRQHKPFQNGISNLNVFLARVLVSPQRHQNHCWQYV